MPDGRGILLPCKAKKRRQYFVYCKIFQRGRPAKDPLRRCRMVVNTGSKVLLNFFQKIAGSRGSGTASVWFQTKLTGAKRLPRGCSGFQARSAAYAATPLRAVLRARGHRAHVVLDSRPKQRPSLLGLSARSAAYAATPLRAVLRVRGQRPLPAGPTPASWEKFSSLS